MSFPEICDHDQEIVNRSAFLYDSFYEALKKLTATPGSARPLAFNWRTSTSQMSLDANGCAARM